MTIPQPRFFVENIGDADRLVIDGDEAHHLIRVLRVQAGESIVLFDGCGGEYDAEVEQIGKNSLSVAIRRHRPVERELSRPSSLAVSLPKGDRQKVLIEKLVELGTTHLVPLETERSVAQPTPQAVERLRRIVIAACKQCGRNRLMSIGEPCSFTELVNKQRDSAATPWIICDPSGQRHLSQLVGVAPGYGIAIGPEGGFSANELQAANAAGFTIANLGPRILRVETAAVYAAAVIAATIDGATIDGAMSDGASSDGASSDDVASPDR